jgi:glycerol-3-phosphate O-acyltransferase
MVQLGDYVQIISATIYAAALLITILQFSAMRKNMFIQSVQQTYTIAMQTLSKNFSSKEYYEMTKESPVVSQYYSLVDSPQQYYIITESFDMFEFIFHLYRTKMIDEELWLRWEAAAKSTMTVPKFKKVWDKTKDIRTRDFREFIDSIQTKESS